MKRANQDRPPCPEWAPYPAAAFDSLAGRRVSELGDGQRRAFVAAHDGPVVENPALQALLARKPACKR